MLADQVKELSNKDLTDQNLKIVGKLNPKKHLEDTVENIHIDNLNQKLIGLVHKTIQ